MAETKTPKPRPGMLARSVLLIAILALGVVHVERVVGDRVAVAKREQHDAVSEQAGNIRGQLEYALHSTVLLARGLVAFVRAVEDPSQAQIREALKTIHASEEIIRNIGLAPDNVLQHVYPLAGNEAALGLRYRDHPLQWPSVERAIRSKQSVLAGPVALVQGGRAVINRTPVFLADGSYWGLISIVVDLPGLLAKAGLPEFAQTFSISLRSELPDGSAGPWLTGELHGDKGRPIIRRLPVPGGHWLLYVRPADGWNDFKRMAWYTRATHYGVLAVVLVLLWVLLRGQGNSRRRDAEVSRLRHQLASSREALEYLARFDPLTNVANRRYFDDVLAREWSTCHRNGLPLSVLIVDIDHFHGINETHGHQTGDMCLMRVAQLITACLQRNDDFVARMGGGEFVVLAPGADLDQAIGLAEKIRRTLSGTLIEPDGDVDQAFRLTASIGVATYQAGEQGTAADYCRRADQALYAAKQAGRNRVQHFSRLGM